MVFSLCANLAEYSYKFSLTPFLQHIMFVVKVKENDKKKIKMTSFLTDSLWICSGSGGQTWHHPPVREACKGWPLCGEINKVSHFCCNPQIALMVANESDTHLYWLSAFNPAAAVIVCDWWKEHTRKNGKLQRSVYFHANKISDYNSGICSIWHRGHCKGSKNTIKIEAKKLQTQACWQHLIDTTVTSVTCLRFL